MGYCGEKWALVHLAPQFRIACPYQRLPETTMLSLSVSTSRVINQSANAIRAQLLPTLLSSSLLRQKKAFFFFFDRAEQQHSPVLQNSTVRASTLSPSILNGNHGIHPTGRRILFIARLALPRACARPLSKEKESAILKYCVILLFQKLFAICWTFSVLRKTWIEYFRIEKDKFVSFF